MKEVNPNYDRLLKMIATSVHAEHFTFCLNSMEVALDNKLITDIESIELLGAIRGIQKQREVLEAAHKEGREIKGFAFGTQEEEMSTPVIESSGDAKE